MKMPKIKMHLRISKKIHGIKRYRLRCRMESMRYAIVLEKGAIDPWTPEERKAWQDKMDSSIPRRLP